MTAVGNLDTLFPLASAVTLRLLNPGSGALEAAAARARAGADWTIDENRALGGRAVKSLNTKTPVVVRNLQTDGQVSNQMYRKLGWVSYLGAPLLARGKAIGIIGVYTKEEYEFSRDTTDDPFNLLSGITNVPLFGVRDALQTHSLRLQDSHVYSAALIQQVRFSTMHLEQPRTILQSGPVSAAMPAILMTGFSIW